MTTSEGSTAQNVALQPVAARPIDPAAEAVQNEQKREGIEDREAVRQTPETHPAPEQKARPRHVDRLA